MEAGCTPRLDSWRCSLNTMGFEISMAGVEILDASLGRRLESRQVVEDESAQLVGYVALGLYFHVDIIIYLS